MYIIYTIYRCIYIYIHYIYLIPYYSMILTACEHYIIIIIILIIIIIDLVLTLAAGCVVYTVYNTCRFAYTTYNTIYSHIGEVH